METESNPQPPPPPTLEYAKRPALAWVSRHRRLLMLVAICIAIAIPVYIYRQPLRQWALWRYWFHAASIHTPPGPIDLFITDPSLARRAASTQPDYVLNAPFTGSTEPTASYLPEAFRQLAQFDPRLHLLGAGTFKQIVFMGKLSRPDGTPRLVFVAGRRASPDRLADNIDIVVLPLPGFFDAPPAGSYWPKVRSFNESYNPAATVYLSELALLGAGTDPDHPSRIVIPYDLHSVSRSRSSISDDIIGHGQLIAELQDDDSLTFTARTTTGQGLAMVTGRIAGDVKTLNAQSKLAQPVRGPTTRRAGRGVPARSAIRGSVTRPATSPANPSRPTSIEEQMRLRRQQVPRGRSAAATSNGP